MRSRNSGGWIMLITLAAWLRALKWPARVVGVALAWGVASTQAATLIVDSNADDGSGGLTLREAVESAASGDTIEFTLTVQGQTIELLTPITIDKDLFITGGSAGPTLTGTNTTLLVVNAGKTVSLTSLRVIGAQAPDAPAASGDNGGAGGGNVIENAGTLNINASVLSGNGGGDGGNAGNDRFNNGQLGGAGGGGAVIASTGTLNIATSTISNNVGGNGGAGNACSGGGGGGGGGVIASTGSLT